MKTSGIVEFAASQVQEVFVAHRNARLTPFGRRLIIDRVRAGQPVAHVAKAMGVSRQCAHRWIKRYAEAGDDGLKDRSSRPYTCPTQTSPDVEALVLAARRERRCGPDQLASDLGVPARTISRILRRNAVSVLADCDPMTGEVIRSSKLTALRYECDHPGELVHVDVKKLGRIPDGGGWRAHGRTMGSSSAKRKARIGFDYVHSMVDDHSRIAYCEIHPDEQGNTCAEFIRRAGKYFASLGVPIQSVMTDNHWSYTKSAAVAGVIAELDASHELIRPHCPWQNGKVERFNRTLQVEWAYRRIFDSNSERTAALPDFVHHYNYERRHHALAGQPPISRLSPT